jgi:periplasmic divalent cation tolerance protein
MFVPVTLLLTSIDDSQAAEALARALVEQRLAACVQVSAAGNSVYRWQDGIETDAEHYLQIKTTPQQSESVVAWLHEHHPYDVPEIIRLDGTAADAYGAWLNESCR